MGNNFTKKLQSRQKMGKYLNTLPNWFFGPTPRIIINEAVLRIKKEVIDFEEDEHWDSSLENSSTSEENTHVYSRVSNCRRKSCYEKRSENVKVKKLNDNKHCCSHSASNRNIVALQEELRLLREQIAQWVNTQVPVAIKNVIPEVSSTIKTPLQLKHIPPPPPMPEHLLGSEKTVKDGNVQASSNILSDISNVKLRPVTSTPVRNKPLPNPTDIRNDLYDILKRRYAAMHSPAPGKLQKEFDDSDEDNNFQPKLKLQPRRVLVC